MVAATTRPICSHIQHNGSFASCAARFFLHLAVQYRWCSGLVFATCVPIYCCVPNLIRRLVSARYAVALAAVCLAGHALLAKAQRAKVQALNELCPIYATSAIG